MTPTEKKLKIALKALEEYAKEGNWKDVEEAAYSSGLIYHAWIGRSYFGWGKARKSLKKIEQIK